MRQGRRGEDPPHRDILPLELAHLTARQGRKTAAGSGGAVDILLEESECRKYIVPNEAKGGGVAPGKTGTRHHAGIKGVHMYGLQSRIARLVKLPSQLISAIEVAEL